MYDMFLVTSIKEVLDDDSIEIVIDVESNLNKTSKEEVTKEEYNEAITKSNLYPKYTFDTFVVGESNKLAHATCLAVADSPGLDKFNPLFLYGGAGLGKTHLMQSIAHYILQHNKNMKVLYVPSNKFTNEIVEAIKKNKTDEFREKYRTVDVLLIDDIQYLIGKESTQQEFLIPSMHFTMKESRSFCHRISLLKKLKLWKSVFVPDLNGECRSIFMLLIMKPEWQFSKIKLR